MSDGPAAVAVAEPFALVDAHVHFFDLDAGTGLSWEWAERALDSSLLPELAAVRARRFLLPDLWAEGGRLGRLEKCVHVQATEGGDPLAETRWLAGLRSRHGAPHAAVARVALDAADAERALDAQREHAFVAGVRDLGKTALLGDPEYAARVELLGARGLLYEVVCGPRRFDALAALARRCPETTIVLEHLGLPPAASGAGDGDPPGRAEAACGAAAPAGDALDAWRRALEALAACGNVRVKLSGLALCDARWTFEHAAVLVRACVDAFGAERCVVGSNFPIDRAGASYPDVIHALAAPLTAAERAAVLTRNAEALYGV